MAIVVTDVGYEQMKREGWWGGERKKESPKNEEYIAFAARMPEKLVD